MKGTQRGLSVMPGRTRRSFEYLVLDEPWGVKSGMYRILSKIDASLWTSGFGGTH